MAYVADLMDNGSSSSTSSSEGVDGVACCVGEGASWRSLTFTSRILDFNLSLIKSSHRRTLELNWRIYADGKTQLEISNCASSWARQFELAANLQHDVADMYVVPPAMRGLSMTLTHSALLLSVCMCLCVCLPQVKVTKKYVCVYVCARQRPAHVLCLSPSRPTTYLKNPFDIIWVGCCPSLFLSRHAAPPPLPSRRVQLFFTAQQIEFPSWFPPSPSRSLLVVSLVIYAHVSQSKTHAQSSYTLPFIVGVLRPAWSSTWHFTAKTQ